MKKVLGRSAKHPRFYFTLFSWAPALARLHVSQNNFQFALCVQYKFESHTVFCSPEKQKEM